ncbi:unnamed protein product [Adineta steineri]|uniref:Uncharacterized protein n=1 Tax=Adineta steineri TaxID=433720 RepID=A0A818THB8_9BILA|nr:unnamed protein product [Adineta steineri]CAF3684712.1 unnamed protein product [Adineta steineri]
MLYKCTVCETSKWFDNSAPNQNAYCDTCKRVRCFTSATHASAKSNPLTSSVVRPSGNGSSLIRSPSTKIIRSCDYFKLCLEYMLSLGFSKRFFNRQQNRCYCEKCYLTTSKDFFIEGGSKYVIPRGWVRFGLYVDQVQAEVEDIWNKWVVSYHGTSPEAAKSIIEHHQFLLPGDQCISGFVIKIRDGHIPGKFQVYTSPSIAYSGHDIYCPSIQFRSNTGQLYKAKVVLQCRQQPQTYTIQAETIDARSKRICPIIPNSELEYFTEVRSSIIPYGLLIRVFQ